MTYPDDIENNVTDELIPFSELLKTDVGVEFMSDDGSHDPLRLFRFIGENTLGWCFPNVGIVLEIHIPLMVTNCSGERSISELKRIKSEIRATMDQDRLNNLSLMSIEHELSRGMDTEKIIREFSILKSRFSIWC